MLFLVAALMLLGIVLGAVVHAPLTVSLVAAAVIGVWLAVFTAREYHGRRTPTDRTAGARTPQGGHS
ncbi:hypothetical protein SLNWT_1768 [Streptomyces albus]|uniref:Small hydrophobic membrane protein n=1 Tax=Streptomyces albus (strain ATCC 21838 / DSM 41398 / FERM P-419 / JCM 4703 / NBRC 107858) TaxID=1081613 RepID=A0A0B5EKU3_STRA4|nr:hypothetical protein SLNWT_1768 [Streptomyces albus]AOU76459.1 hypothetical protein SLNHY_1768 [Streptomyces albus]AYN32245.1 hypothetical protein DUI70_1742 [Streptomyces albus]